MKARIGTLAALIGLCATGAAIACLTCDHAHEVDQHECSPDNCLDGYYWTTAVPGNCEEPRSMPNECKEDGTTNVTIHKRECTEEWIGTNCKHPWPAAASDTKQKADCYYED